MLVVMDYLPAVHPRPMNVCIELILTWTGTCFTGLQVIAVDDSKIYTTI